MNGINYYFRVKITSNSSLISEDGIFGLGIQNCRDISIKSKMFDTFEDSFAKLSALMDHLSVNQTYLDACENMIITRANPGTDTDEWDKNSILRMYIIDPTIIDLQDPNYQVTDYFVMGQIDADEDSVKIVKPRDPVFAS